MRLSYLAVAACLFAFPALAKSKSTSKVDPKDVAGTVKWLCHNFERAFQEGKQSCKGQSPNSVNAYHQCLEVVNSGLSQKRLSYDASAAKKCVAAQRSYLKTPSASSRQAMLATCGAVVTGRKAKGEPCESPLDCAGSLVCGGMKGAASGQCMAPAGEGEFCDTDKLGSSAFISLLQEGHAVCGPGLYCSEPVGKPRVCAELAKASEASFQISAGSACKDSGQCKGVCENGTCKAYCGSG